MRMTLRGKNAVGESDCQLIEAKFPSSPEEGPRTGVGVVPEKAGV